MRLSDVKGERTLDVIADIVGPIAEIAKDPEIVESVKGINERSYSAFAPLAALLLRKHRNDVVTVLSSIAGVKPDEYLRDMTLGSLVADVYELMTDSEFLTFLPQQPETNGKSGAR